MPEFGSLKRPTLVIKVGTSTLLSSSSSTERSGKRGATDDDDSSNEEDDRRNDGSSSGSGGGSRAAFSLSQIGKLVDCVAELKSAGFGVVLVTSGAVGAGCVVLKLRARPSSMREKQAVSAVGQCALIRLYQDLFAVRELHVAQLLMTRTDFVVKSRYTNFRNTLLALLEDYNVVPVVNENDSVATSQLQFGDNDTFAAQCAISVAADALFILTDIDFLWNRNPEVPLPEASPPEPIPFVGVLSEVYEYIDAKARATCRSESSTGGRREGGKGRGVETGKRGGSAVPEEGSLAVRKAEQLEAGSAWGSGGMRTKLLAARIATASGVHVGLVNGVDPSRLKKMLCFLYQHNAILRVPAGARGSSFLAAETKKSDDESANNKRSDSLARFSCDRKSCFSQSCAQATPSVDESSSGDCDRDHMTISTTAPLLPSRTTVQMHRSVSQSLKDFCISPEVVCKIIYGEKVFGAPTGDHLRSNTTTSLSVIAGEHCCHPSSGKAELPAAVRNALPFVGTLFAADLTHKARSPHRRWILSLPISGRLLVDPGAVRAVIQHRKSLFAAGIVGVEGDFRVGDVVAVGIIASASVSTRHRPAEGGSSCSAVSSKTAATANNRGDAPPSHQSDMHSGRSFRVSTVDTAADPSSCRQHRDVHDGAADDEDDEDDSEAEVFRQSVPRGKKNCDPGTISSSCTDAAAGPKTSASSRNLLLADSKVVSSPTSASSPSLVLSSAARQQADQKEEKLAVCMPSWDQENVRCLVNFSSAELRIIKGRHSSTFRELLGYGCDSEVANRSNVVILSADLKP